MPKPAPLTAPEPSTLFYPVSSETLSSEALGFVAWAIIPALLILAVAGPALLLVIPVCWLTCKLEGVPFTWNIPELFNTIDEIYYKHNPNQLPQK